MRPERHFPRKPARVATALLAAAAVAGGCAAFGMPALDASSGEPHAVRTIAGAIVVADINQVGRS
jgi:hypothetical protein